MYSAIRLIFLEGPEYRWGPISSRYKPSKELASRDGLVRIPTLCIEDRGLFDGKHPLGGAWALRALESIDLRASLGDLREC